jgi:hypothetical protein
MLDLSVILQQVALLAYPPQLSVSTLYDLSPYGCTVCTLVPHSLAHPLLTTKFSAIRQGFWVRQLASLRTCEFFS